MKKLRIIVTDREIPTPEDTFAFNVVVVVVTAGGTFVDIPCLFLEAIIE